jgi:hypothetical protein
MIEENGYLVRYHDDQNAVHYTLREWGAMNGDNPKFKEKTGDILISAYDTLKNKRVILDGVHRGAVMSSVHSNESDFVNRIVYEWFGRNVKELFPNDFKQFYRDDASTLRKV